MTERDPSVSLVERLKSKAVVLEQMRHLFFAAEVAELLREAASRLAEGTRGDRAALIGWAAQLVRLVADPNLIHPQRLDSDLAEPVREIALKLRDYATALSTPPASPAATSAITERDALEMAYELLGRIELNTDRLEDERANALMALSASLDRVSAAEQPAQTCATCKHYDPSATACYRHVVRPFPYTKQEFGCTLHEPAAPRSVVAPEKE